jgi:hypothetical protein
MKVFWYVLAGPNGELLPGKEGGLLDSIGQRVAGPFATLREAKEAINSIRGSGK